MYISKLFIKGYKNTYTTSSISLNKGLNILIGENGCGKTAVINALRLLFRETEAYYSFSMDDFYCSLDKKVSSEEIEIDATFTDLSENEKLTFLSWCDAEFDAHLHLKISENQSKPGNVKRRYWGGQSSAGIFEEDTFDRIECIYLPPLRDAESKLTSGRRSRLATLIKKQYGDKKDNLVQSVTEFNNSITEDKSGKHSEILSVKKTINNKIFDTLGKELSQSINLQFSEARFNKIIENIQMVFYPKSGATNIELFRDLATNSLGYNNLLYIATVLSELELIEDSDVFTILLIEEPEAHLHPQLQVKFIKYLENLSQTLTNAQIIVSTHSPVLASSVELNKLIHLSGRKDSIIATTLSEMAFNDSVAEKYINRWLDVTKSTMLFSRGIILVEGIAEALVLPKLAEIILSKYNNNHGEEAKLATTLDEMGVSVINIHGINFKYFMKLFGNFQGSSGPNIPIYCAGVTDRDPDRDTYPQKGEKIDSNNPICDFEDEINSNEMIRVFISPLKTFEYDLAMDNPKMLALTLKSVWTSDEGPVCKKLDEIIDRGGLYTDKRALADDAKYIYDHIDSSGVGKGVYAQYLAENITGDFIIPKYIEDAVLWACGGIKNE